MDQDQIQQTLWEPREYAALRQRKENKLDVRKYQGLMKPDDLTQSMNTRPKADAAIKLLIRHVGYH